MNPELTKTIIIRERRRKGWGLEAGCWQKEGKSAVNTGSKHQQGEVSTAVVIQQKPISVDGNKEGGQPAVTYK